MTAAFIGVSLCRRWTSFDSLTPCYNGAMRELAGKVAVVTGGGSGIGAALARAFAAEAMDVVVADIELEAAERVATELRGAGRRALAVRTDVSSRTSVEALAERTYAELGACHLLCNNAGVLMMGALETRTLRDWEWVLGVNLWGVIHGLLAFLPRMLAQPGEKQIVNTGSTSGLLAAPGVGIYGTAKFGVVGLSEHLRHDLARHGIGVSVLCPGGVQTNILHSERNRPSDLGKSKISREDVERMLGTGPLHPDELQSPETIAAAVLEGIRANDAFIVTHAHYRAGVEARHAELMRAFDKAEARRR
jgi:NAD(P)-dependent dehydrogenase (short-subunit alcohol dehydrogenase family)